MTVVNQVFAKIAGKWEHVGFIYNKTEVIVSDGILDGAGITWRPVKGDWIIQRPNAGEAQPATQS